MTISSPLSADQARITTLRWFAGALLFALVAGGCSVIGPRSLKQSRLQYNDVVKTTSEEEMLLNIVRLRYVDTPSSLQISNIAAQFELLNSLQLTPFFVASGAEPNRSYTAVVPQATIGGADRPTFSLTPLDESEFARKLFTPLTLDGVIYLVKTTWPISTVFRLYLENLNWVSNAETASGPTPRHAPAHAEFLQGINALQTLQDEGHIVFALEERRERLGGSVPASTVTASNVIDAAKDGNEYHPDPGGQTWTLYRKIQQPVLLIDPRVVDSAEMEVFTRTFRLKRGLAKYDITQDGLNPFPVTYPPEGVDKLDLETRSLLQGLFFVSHGVEVPPEHASRGVTRTTLDAAGQPFDWRLVMAGFFRVNSAKEQPQGAHVAVQYKGYWFYIDETDIETKSTFTLLMELARLNLTDKGGTKPLFTLPLGGR
ncbi:MAG: hypothetical protein U1E63_05850 [Burkholderiales bacterium]